MIRLLQPEAGPAMSLGLGLIVAGVLPFIRSLWSSRPLAGRRERAPVTPAIDETLVDAGAFADAQARAANRRETADLDAADLIRLDSDAG
jgi:hypothetical protein